MATISKLNTKDVATKLAVLALEGLFKQASKEASSKILEVARKWGAKIGEDEENKFITEITELFAPPNNWPSIEVVASVTGGATVTTNTKPPAKAKSNSDKAPSDKRKAADFRALVVPPGVAMPSCPTIMKGTQKPCGKDCKRVLDEHDPSNPECAKLECDHLYCGIHVVKAQELSGGGGASKRLDKSADPDAKPIIYNDNGSSTQINASEVSEIKQGAQSAASKETMNKLMAKMKAKKANKDEDK